MDILDKITSRKFLAAIAGVVIGLAMIFGIDENTITTVAGAVVSVSSLITYIITEGKIDAAAVVKVVTDVEQVVGAITEDEGEDDE